MEIPGHRFWTSHGFTCAVRKDLTSHAWNSCPSVSMDFLRVEAGWEVWGAGSKQNVLIPPHPSSSKAHGEPGLFSQGLEEPEGGVGSGPV